MLDNNSQSILDLLLHEYEATRPNIAEQLKEIEEECERSGKSVMTVIQNYGLFQKEEVLTTMANSLGTYVWDGSEGDISHDVVNKLDTTTARSYRVIPIYIDDDGSIHIAMRAVFDYQSLESLQFILGCNLAPVVVSEDDFDRELERYYPEEQENVHDIIVSMGGGQEIDEDMDAKNLEVLANEAPIVKFVNVIIQQGIRDKASDIHFEPFEKNFRIRYRVDGTLYEMPEPPKSLAIPVISRIKIISGLNISERRRPQDGRIELKYNGRPVDLRVSCLPTSYGESVVLRVLDRSVVNLSLDSLGLSKEMLAMIRDLIHLPNGILLVTGPTGSGKTTTLYSALSEINVVEDKLLTAEDPVEYDIEGIIQVPINDAVGMTFGKALRAFLRQDPDRILVGEIRDFETAQIAVEASLTGHFVFSTLHTNDAASTVTRLVDMGIEPFLICSSLSGVLSQRLIRRVCPHCKERYTPTDEELERLHMSREEIGDRKFVKGKGCHVCLNTGYKGRKSIVELLIMCNEIRELVYAGASMQNIREKAREMGMRTMREDGVHAIFNHETTVEEVIRYT